MAAMLVHEQENTAEAKARYTAIAEAEPNAAVAANNLAWMLADEGKDFDEALRLAQRAVRLAPQQPHVHDTLGWVYYKQNLPTLAIPHFRRVSRSIRPIRPITTIWGWRTRPPAKPSRRADSLIRHSN